MSKEESIGIDPDEAIRVIQTSHLLTTLVRVSDAGRRTMCTAESKKGVFLGVFAGEVYVDKHVEVCNYSGSPEDHRDSGFWVYDKTRDLIAFHAKRLREGSSEKPKFTNELSDDVIKHLSAEEYQRFSQTKDEFVLRAFQPGDWQRHVQFVERNLGYMLEPEEEFLGPVRLNEMFGANCFVHSRRPEPAY